MEEWSDAAHEWTGADEQVPADGCGRCQLLRRRGGGGVVRGRDECAEEMTTCVVQLQAGRLSFRRWGGFRGNVLWTVNKRDVPVGATEVFLSGLTSFH